VYQSGAEPFTFEEETDVIKGQFTLRLWKPIQKDLMDILPIVEQYERLETLVAM
jgi:hypothetical protein